MTALEGSRTSVFRYLAVLGAAAMMMALLPLTGTVSAQQPDLANACPVEAPQAPFTDRDDVPDDHVRNVDCAAFLNIVRGFEGNLYRPRLAVRRDQMATFIAQGLDAAGVQLPAGDQDQFTDVTTGPHRINVNRLAEADIVRGGAQSLPADQYGPGLRTRRDQMASFLMRAAGYALAGNPDAFEDDFNAPAAQVFDDVPSGNTHFGNVNAASQNGLAQGFGGGIYRPGQATTRDQMASFVVRLLNFLARAHTVEITEQSAEQAPVGGEITVTATVFDQYGNPATESATVTFSATTTPPESDTVVTDANSQADFTFTSSVEGTVTVTAEIDGPGGNFIATGDSHSVQKQFGGDTTTTTTTLPPEGGDGALVAAAGGKHGTTFGGAGGSRNVPCRAINPANHAGFGGNGGDSGDAFGVETGTVIVPEAGQGGGGGGSSATPTAPGVNGDDSPGTTGGLGGTADGEGGDGGDGGDGGQDGQDGLAPGGGGGGRGEGAATSSGEGAPGQVIISWEGAGGSPETFAAPGTHSFTVPDGVTGITVQAWGSGGNGGTATFPGEPIPNPARGGGGGGAYCATSTPATVVAGDVYEVIVGEPTLQGGGESRVRPAQP